MRKQLEKQNTDCKKKRKKNLCKGFEIRQNFLKFHFPTCVAERERERERERRKALKHSKMSIFRACSKKRKVKFSYYRDKLDF